MLDTALTRLLGLRYPIVQSGMRRIAGPELAAAVSNAGGLGILAGFTRAPDDLREDIRRIRALTARPFGVNLWLHPAVVTPIDPRALEEGRVQRAQEVLNGIRARLELPASEAVPQPLPAWAEEAFELILEERVPVLSVGVGDPGADRVSRAHACGMRVMAMVTNTEDARAVVASGVDAVVAQGSEAGGHRSQWRESAPGGDAGIGSMALIPQLADAVKVPVIAAGGIADGRGVIAALALGASGVLLGTRFVATREAMTPPGYKKAILERRPEETIVTRSISGLPGRVFENELTGTIEAKRDSLLPPLVQTSAAQDIYETARERDDMRFFPMFAGQSTGLIHDTPGAGAVVEQIAREAEAVLAQLRGR